MAETPHVQDGHAAGTRFRVVQPARPVARTLVFLHGVGMQLEFWQPQLAYFSRNYRCVAYDMLGHGDSPLPPQSPTLADYSAQFAQVVEHLSLGPVTFIGHSMGALIAIDAAIRYPDRVERLVAMNGVYDRTPAQSAAIAARVAQLDGKMPDWSATLDRWFGAAPSEQAAERASLHDLLQRIQPEGYARTYRLFAHADQAHVQTLRTLRAPALFLTGELDPNSTPAMSEAMAAACPDGRACILAGERHMMSFVHPASTNRAITEFLHETGSPDLPVFRSPTP
ncbi:alpha/beta hydrolase [Acetobacter sp. TBRC 12305]|uniref:Alpha/beta fold hydrolase n=1 Tax=Acetobacter garciniae TaxID=2817435 RepID=A0A939KPQ2_9PROT|nr:alpha/beta hydrolase [Acetobacter garciniae]MBO1324264.1 alpha/beta fold hydrolase [Acetobacter garciniae]MBX0343953.1 alpha/beta hydrolase [Acetobacter garciniae]